MIARLALLLALLLPVPVLAQAPDNLQALGRHSLELVNQARRAAGLDILELEENLTEAALAHARDMLARDYFSHTSPDGGTVMDRYLEAGGSDGRVVRENISTCEGCRDAPDLAAVEEMHEGWMNSPGHRANILAEGLTDYGFAVVQDREGRRYGVETFAGPGTPRGRLPQGSVESIGPEAQTQLAAEIINGIRADAQPVEADERLRRHLASRMPEGEIGGVRLSDLRLLRNLPANLPFLSYQVLSGECGGCGAEPTNSDVHYFLDMWRESNRSRAILTDAELTHVAFVIAADHEGRKLAMLLMAGE